MLIKSEQTSHSTHAAVIFMTLLPVLDLANAEIMLGEEKLQLIGDGALFSFGLPTGERPLDEGDEDLPPGVLIVTAAGDVDRRIGDGARPNLGLVAGDKAKASI